MTAGSDNTHVQVDEEPASAAAAEIVKYVSWTGYFFRNHSTWHIAVTAASDMTPVECFEIHWDDAGNPKATGQRKLMSERQAEATQRATRVVEVRA